jgi:hypothetical protein
MHKLRTFIASLLLAVGCGRTVKEMPVVYFTNTWELGEVKECQTKSPNTGPLGEYLLCSKSDYESALLSARPNSGDLIQNPKIFAVTFKGPGHSSFYEHCIDWHCRHTADGISCN